MLTLSDPMTPPLTAEDFQTPDHEPTPLTDDQARDLWREFSEAAAKRIAEVTEALLQRAQSEGAQSEDLAQTLAHVDRDLVRFAEAPAGAMRTAARKALRDLRKAGLISAPAKLGEIVPVNTYPEVRAAKQALMDGAQGKNWNDAEGEIALHHSPPKGSTLYARFEADPLQKWWQFDPSHSALRARLAELEPDAPLCLDLCLYVAVRDDRAPIETDELIRGLGWNPETTAERREMRRKVWGWVTAFACLSVSGNRPGAAGRWKDQLTGKTLDLRTRGPLILIGSTSSPEGQLSLDGSDAPINFTLAPGDWLAKFRGDGRVLASLGNTWKIAQIPGGQPSGAWARAYAHVLLQKWRERAAYDKPPTFTRQGLHDAGGAGPSLGDVLAGRNPSRAIEYDRDAWAYLKQAGIIATDPKKLAFTPKSRQGWSAAFLTEELTIRPGPDIEAQLSEIRPLPKATKRKAKPKAPRP